MNLRATKGAARQIDAVLRSLHEVSPVGSVNVRNRLVQVLDLLRRHPTAGRETERKGVRRVVLNPYPYLIFYRVTENEIIVMRFRHGARDPQEP